MDRPEETGRQDEFAPLVFASDPFEVVVEQTAAPAGGAAAPGGAAGGLDAGAAGGTTADSGTVEATDVGNAGSVSAIEFANDLRFLAEPSNVSIVGGPTVSGAFNATAAAELFPVTYRWFYNTAGNPRAFVDAAGVCSGATTQNLTVFNLGLGQLYRFGVFCRAFSGPFSLDSATANVDIEFGALVGGGSVLSFLSLVPSVAIQTSAVVASDFGTDNVPPYSFAWISSNANGFFSIFATSPASPSTTFRTTTPVTSPGVVSYGAALFRCQITDSSPVPKVAVSEPILVCLFNRDAGPSLGWEPPDVTINAEVSGAALVFFTSGFPPGPVAINFINLSSLTSYYQTSNLSTPGEAQNFTIAPLSPTDGNSAFQLSGPLPSENELDFCNGFFLISGNGSGTIVLARNGSGADPQISFTRTTP